MNPSRRRAGPGNRAVPVHHACGLALVWCAGHALLSPPVAAQAPTASRQELMQKWDIDRDGKVDASEAEIARGRMRRARTDAIMNSGTDPVTGKPRVATDPVTGRPVPTDETAADRSGPSFPADEDGLILVPGNGEKPRATGDAAAGNDMQPRPSRRDSEPLPGTRAPGLSPTIPSVTPRPSTGLSNGLSSGPPVPDTRSQSPGMSSAPGRQGVASPRDAGGAAPGSRARMVPGMPPAQNPGRNPGQIPGQSPALRGSQAMGAGQERQQQERMQPGTRPGIIAGGVRAGAPGARPGYGSGGPPADLNAGRPIGQGPYAPRPGIGPYRGPTTSGAPAVGVPTSPRPGMGQPDGGRSVSRNPNTVPRAPRMTTDEFYGR